MNKFHQLVRIGIVLAALVAICLWLPSQLQAQSFFGSVVGTVTDASGAVVPNANVTISNLGTNETRSMKADAAGNYRFLNLVPADYKVTVEAANFKRFLRQPIAVTVDTTVRIDAALEVGTTTETVEVTTQAPLLQTESGTLGGQVEGKRVTEMPLNGRNVMNLIALVPGVIPQGATMGTTSLNNGQGTHTTYGSWGNYQIGGGIASQSAQYIDGVTVNMVGNGPAIIPTQDVVQEFKVATNSVSPEFGRFAGGVVEMTTKSGSNNWHGSGYEYVRNKLFNANDWFSNHTVPKTPRVQWNQNQFGVVASGPAIKDKLFGMFAWEHFISKIGIPQTSNTPTLNYQKGIIPGKIVDPTGICAAIAPPSQAGTNIDNSGAYDATGNVTTIPQSCWDETATVMKALYPAPNLNVPIGQTNWYSTPVMGSVHNQYNGRADWVISPKQRLFARFTWWGVLDDPVRVYLDNNGFKSANGITKMNTQQGVLGDTYTLNPTTILDLRLGYTRLENWAFPENGGNLDMATFKGNWSTLAPLMKFHEYPVPFISGDGINNLNPMDDTATDYFHNYSLAASVTKIVGQHTLKIGTEERLMVDVRHGGGGNMDPSGKFTFDSSLVKDYAAGSKTGTAWSAFLLGLPTSATITVSNPRGSFVWPQSYYINDTWNTTKKLTLTLGLRYDLPSGLAERRDKTTVLIPAGTATDGTNTVNGTLAFAKSTLYSGRATQLPTKKEFQPRVGLAYRLTNSTAIRAGYGLTFVPPDVAGANPVGAVVNSATTTVSNALNASGIIPAGTKIYRYSNAFSANSSDSNYIQQPLGRANTTFMNSLVNKGQVVTGAYPYEPYGYNQQYNLTIGQQFKGDMLLELGYVGARGTHLPGGTYSIDEWDWKTHSGEANLLTNTTCFGATRTVAQCERPYPAYKDLRNTNHNNGSSTYNSLQGKFEKRFRNGGAIGASYLWSKFISNTDTMAGGGDPHGTRGAAGSNGVIQDYNNPKAERSILSFNVPQRLVINYVLPLPFGKGQQWAANTNPIVSTMISGWAVNGITVFQSGTPAYLSVQGGNYMTNNLGAGTLRPNYTAGCSKSMTGSRFERAQTGKTWFNTSCFTAPSDFTLGNQPRVDGSIRSQGTDNWDFTAAKTTTIRENLNLQFRAEFFNIFNHPQFSPPSWMLNNQFGQILAQQNQQRLVQLSLRLNY